MFDLFLLSFSMIFIYEIRTLVFINLLDDNDYIVLIFVFVDAGADGLRLDNLSARVNCLLRVR